MAHRTTEELEAAIDDLREAPGNDGRVELIVRRPVVGEREVVESATLDETVGLVGDCWQTRGSRSTPDGAAHPEMQITLMNVRCTELVAGERDRWPLAGDQFYVDFDLSTANLPAGTRIQLGTAVVEVSAAPHTGCAKFTQRFGLDAMRFVNSPAGRELRLRGVNTKVVVGGTVSVGDPMRKLGS
ncbi:MAG: MOSC domain-containing protein [Actinomycetota bacterium]|nr:MOSC domain-containing protein [Actinomycetota bacterium]